METTLKQIFKSEIITDAVVAELYNNYTDEKKAIYAVCKIILRLASNQDVFYETEEQHYYRIKNAEKITCTICKLILNSEKLNKDEKLKFLSKLKKNALTKEIKYAIKACIDAVFMNIKGLDEEIDILFLQKFL